MITKDDDKGDDKKLKDQSRRIQEFKIKIKKNSRLKKKVQRQESRFKVQDLKNQDQDSRFKNEEKNQSR